jgi:phosphocarrier protein HPr
MSAKKIPDGEVLTKELTIANKSGIHARPAAMFVKIANRFGSDIFVEKDGEKINGKSIMGLMMLAAGPGSKVKLHVKGIDAAAALAELEGLVQRKFDEEFSVSHLPFEISNTTSPAFNLKLST